MGNHQSDVPLATDLVDSSIVAQDHVFKVDNINSHGRKHSSAKIHLTNDNLCIRQKHRQALHIPLDTIKRYGLDGSIFILECGRRAPLGQARYAFRCKQARRLVECLDQRIHLASEQLFAHDPIEISSSTLTNVSSAFNEHASQQRRQRRAQSAHVRSPSPLSLSSSTSFYRNSEPDLSENYFPFETIGQRDDRSELSSVDAPMNYVQVNVEATATSSPAEPSTDAFPTPAVSTLPVATATKSYVYIDHEKTNALKDVAQQRLQQHARRVDA